MRDEFPCARARLAPPAPCIGDVGEGAPIVSRDRSAILQPSKVPGPNGPTPASDVITVAGACVRNYFALIDPIRGLARKLGYAIGVHGSLARDVDLIAIPVESWAVAPIELIDGVAEIVRAALGVVIVGKPDRKSHGRSAWTIGGRDAFYIDLSVCPRIVNGELVDAA